jgi:hypothetical protein
MMASRPVPAVKLLCGNDQQPESQWIAFDWEVRFPADATNSAG